MIRPRDAADRLQERWKCFSEQRRSRPACPRCQSDHVRWEGWQTRSTSAMVEDAVRHFVGIRMHRASCLACGNDWVVRPPGISPNRHFQLCVVAQAISHYLFDKGATQAKIAQDLDCSVRTVGRWLRWVAEVANPVALLREILEAAGQPILPAVPPVADVARKARTTARRQFVTRAAQVLSYVEALGVALGLEPPGLRSVIERALRDRATIATYAKPLIPEFAF